MWKKRLKKKVFYIKSLQVDIEMLANSETDAETKAALIKLAEKIRFSDPMSNEVFVDLDTKISEKITALEKSDNKSEIIAELDLLLTEWNKKAKILK